jgi:hypothetical protein
VRLRIEAPTRGRNRVGCTRNGSSQVDIVIGWARQPKLELRLHEREEIRVRGEHDQSSQRRYRARECNVRQVERHDVDRLGARYGR